MKFSEKEYENVNIIDDKLKGAVYYLVAGHGGPDPGAVGRYNNWQLCEDEYAYDVTLRLARKLIEHGALVYMIIRDPNDGIRNDSYLKADKDEVCYPDSKIPINQLRRLKQRTDAVNELYGKHRGSFQRMIALHVDSRSHGENIDVFFYHDRQSKTGRKAAMTLKNKFQQKYDLHQPGRGYKGTVSDRNLYVVRNSYPVAVYIELGNINHRRDQQRFIISSNRQALANWLYEGLVDDLSIINENC
jgi:N-acetylmuramoyl-L-alanine amidase